MVRTVDKSTEDDLIALINADRIFGTEIFTNYAVYGGQGDRTATWVVYGGSAPRLVLQQVGSVLTVCGTPDNESADSLNEFLGFLGGWRRLTACRELGEMLAERGGYNCRSGAVMRYGGKGKNQSSAGCKVNFEPNLKSIYRLYNEVCAENGEVPFDMWYADKCYRLRHGLERVCLVDINGEAASTAAARIAGAAAVIDNVATLPNYRGRGYAKTAVSALCEKLCEKEIFLLSADEKTDLMYEKIGFVRHSDWVSIER